MKPRVVGLQGFEPWTSCTRGRRSTKLSHSPILGTATVSVLPNRVKVDISLLPRRAPFAPPDVFVHDETG